MGGLVGPRPKPIWPKYPMHHRIRCRHPDGTRPPFRPDMVDMRWGRHYQPHLGPARMGKLRTLKCAVSKSASTDWASCSRSTGQGLITTPSTSEHGLRLGSLCGCGKSGHLAQIIGLTGCGVVVQFDETANPPCWFGMSASSSRRRECNGERNKRETDVPVGGQSERA